MLFAPEADGVTSAMRAEHYVAVDVVARAASWVTQTGPTRDIGVTSRALTGQATPTWRTGNSRQPDI